MDNEVLPSAQAPTLLPGPSARELTVAYLRLFGASIAGAVGIAVGRFLPGGLSEWVSLLGLVICLVFSVKVFRINGRLAAAQRREAAAGYSTLPGARRDLWRLDAKTGAVIKRPEGP